MSSDRTGVNELSEIYSLLSNSRRLQVVRYLSLFEVDTTIEVRQIARAIGGIEQGISPKLVESKDYESVYNGLIQCHLPKLAEQDIIMYNTQSKKVTVTPKLRQYQTVDQCTRFIMSFNMKI